MDRFLSSTRSPKIDTPVCDSDEEIFFGPVTSKELQKASKLKRQTQCFFPSFDWKPSTSPVVKKNDKPTDNKAKDIKIASPVTAEKPNMSVSADSLDSQSYVTSSEKHLDSSKGDYWSALSADSLNTNSHTSLNDAVLVSKFSMDSLESVQVVATDKKSAEPHAPMNAVSQYSNTSADSLEGNFRDQMNEARIHSGSYNEGFSGNTELPAGAHHAVSGFSSDFGTQFSQSDCKLVNQTYSASESSFNRDQAPSLYPNLSETVRNQKDETFSIKTSSQTEGNNTYTVEDRSYQTSDDGEVADADSDLPKQVDVDKDGGYLSILSEAALYHASQLKENINTDPHVMEESTSTTQSLEDRFKVFGIEAGELEDQQLTDSIMYVTGRESHLPCSEAESNSYYTGRNSNVSDSIKSIDEQCGQTTMKRFTDASTFSSQASSDCGKPETVNITSSSQGSASNCLQYSSELNHRIENGSLGSALQDTENDTSYEQRGSPDCVDESAVQDQSSSYVQDSSEISGVAELSAAEENASNNFTHPHREEEEEQEPLHDDSNASSFGGELNDTLEEYEMMMRYGVDYILGQKGNRKRSGHADNVKTPPPETRQGNIPLSSPTGNHSRSPLRSACPRTLLPNPTDNSVEYLHTVDVSPGNRRVGNSIVRDRKILSPLHKQVLRPTPQKNAREATSSSKGSAQKVASKLPRVATMTPSKVPSTSPHHSSKHCPVPTYQSSDMKTPTKPPVRPVTPSETKSTLFKKPVTPSVVSSRIPKTVPTAHQGPKLNTKVLEKIQSPVGAYIHNTPSPVLVTNVKAKSSDKGAYEKEMHARALWRAGEVKSCIPKPGGSQMSNAENMNPNIGCGLPPVKYTKAPCIKLDETSKISTPRGGEKMTKLLDAPSPQVIKHEGRLRVNCGSPQLAAKMQSMADTLDDSMLDVHSISGDISVCVTQQATRTHTLGH